MNITSIITSIKAFFSTTTDTILADMVKSIDRLEGHAAKQSAKATKHFNDSDQSELKGIEAVSAAQRANRIKEKLTTLVA
jgi:hypothetical protein